MKPTPEHPLVAPITQEDFDERLVREFKRNEGVGWGFCLTKPYRLIEAFTTELQEEIRSSIKQALDKEGDVFVMDQGSGQGTSLHDFIVQQARNRTAIGRIIGYMISGALNRVELEEIKKGELPGKRQYKTEHPNCVLMGIEKDIHNIMAMMDERFSLILSNHTYGHLVSAWLTLGRSMNSLEVGGVALIGWLPNNKIIDENGKVIPAEDYVEFLKKLNPGYKIWMAKQEHRPVLYVQKLIDEPFITKLHHGTMDNGEITRYKAILFSSKKAAEGYLPFD